MTLGLLAEYGAFEIVQYQTFTVAIFTEFKLGFDTAAACALSLVLVALGVAALAGELPLVRRGRWTRSGAGARRVSARVRLGRRWTIVALCGLLALCGLALGVPLGSLVYWLIHGGSTTLPPASILTDAAHTAEFSAAAAALATALAIPVTAAAMRHRNRLTILIERLALLPQALPGLVIALGLVSFTVRYALPLYESALELIVAYAILFLPLAIVGVRAALAHAPPRLEEVGRSLGRRPATVWLRVILPLIAPGLGVAFSLVFISSCTELTATLLLQPHRRGHARHPVLGVHERLLLRRGGSLRGADGADLGDPGVRAQPAHGDARAQRTPDMMTMRRRTTMSPSAGDPAAASGCSASDLWVLDLWKGYAADAPSVLAGVNLSVPAGSLVAVLGLSGCGKTTLLRAIAGFERVQRGRIALGTRTLDDGHRVYVAPERRGIGYVPQEGALFPNLSVRANVAFGLSRAQRRTNVVDELLELVGLVPLARRFPHQLSGGEQQRVALARALARRPEVLLLDEPFSSLDASLRATVREEVSALLRSRGATTVLVTHDQEEALSLADSVAVLRDGVIVQQGTPAELYSTPVDARARELSRRGQPDRGRV